MDSTLAAVAALVVGLVVGASIAGLIVFAMRVRDRALADESVDVPEGVSAVLRGMDDAAVVVDASSTVRVASAAAEMFGMRLGESLASTELRRLARTARGSGLAETDTFRLERGSTLAQSRLVTARAVAVTPRLVLVVVRDITEQERVEEMRRDFVANTSHELKTPVGAVMLLAEAVESAADDPHQVRVFAARLTAEATRLSQLTSRIMNLSRLQAADDLRDVRDVAVDQIIASGIEGNALAADSAAVEVVRGGDRGVYVRGEAQMLTDAVGNLIANAIAYSPSGSTVGVGVRAVEGIVEIAVTDRGIGIPEGEQQRVFERFYRADQARSRRTGGTGLGLSIVKHAVQRHGGEVTLWSKPGRGSTFTIRLPRIDGPVEDDALRRKKKKSRKATRTAVSSATTMNGERR